MELDRHLNKELTSRGIRKEGCLHCGTPEAHAEKHGECAPLPEILARKWVRHDSDKGQQTFFTKAGLKIHLKTHKTDGKELEKLDQQRTDHQSSTELLSVLIEWIPGSKENHSREHKVKAKKITRKGLCQFGDNQFSNI